MNMSANDEDESVVAAARSRLGSTGYACVAQVMCRFDDGTLVLTGRVSSYYLKQIAQAAVMSIDGVERVVNDIEVRGSR